jgi:hypothetical protein
MKTKIILKLTLLTLFFVLVSSKLNSKSKRNLQTTSPSSITNQSNSNCIDATTAYGQLANNPCSTSSSGQYWTFSKQADGYFFIYSSGIGGQVMDISGGSVIDGTPAIVYDINGDDNQRFSFEIVGNAYSIKSKISGLCVSISGGVVIQTACNTSDSRQLFTFDSVPSTGLACYSSCSVCSQTGTSTQHMCIAGSCKSGYYNLEDDNTMCYEPNETVTGYYFNTNIWTKCYDSCASCTVTGTSADNLCDTCKTNYYPLEDKLTNCNLGTNALDNYYLDSTANQFKRCYPSCATCQSTGTLTQHKCQSCESSYYARSDDSTMCHQSSETVTAYYFNTNVWTKCYDSCSSCSTTGTATDNLCSSCMVNYYPLEDKLTDCKSGSIDYYYLGSIKYKKCYSSCLTCLGGGSSDRHLCQSCKSGYYARSDDSEMCHQPSETVTGYYFNTNIWTKCYDSCASCTTTGNATDNLCDTCMTNYYPLEDKLTNCNLGTNALDNYYLDSNTQFKRCYTSCATCQSIGTSTQHQCQSCESGYYARSDDSTMCHQQSETVVGYYFNTNQWTKCFDSCASCTTTGTSTDNLCDTCKTDYYPLEDKLTNCNLGTNALDNYYLDGTVNQFKRCYTSCATCQSKGTSTQHKCQSCELGYYARSDDSTMCHQSSETVTGYYFNTNVWSKCFDSCASCTTTGNATDNLCDACKTNYYPLEDKLTNCNLGTNALDNYYLDGIVNQFKRCYTSCVTCQSKGTSTLHKCQSCESSYYARSDDSAMCHQSSETVTGYYFNTNVWTKCYDSCASCTTTGTTTDNLCGTCMTNYYQLEDKLTNCNLGTNPPNNYYLDLTVNPNIFKRCYVSCSACQTTGTSTQHKCQSCESGYYKLEDYSTMCYQPNETVIGYYFNTNIWTKCFSSCASCSSTGNAADNLCSSCKTNYYPLEDKLTNCNLGTNPLDNYYLNSNKFKRCYNSCVTCQSTGTSTQHQCQSCESGYYARSDDSTMCHQQSETVVGYYFNTNVWTKCYDSCASCTTTGTASDNICGICMTNYYPLEDKLTNCNLGTNQLYNYYLDSTVNKFKRCYTLCSSCQATGTQTQHKCTQCKTGYYTLADDNTMCYLPTENLPGYYFNTNIYSNCYDSCATCTTGGNSSNHNCSTCKASYYNLEDKLSDCYLSANSPPNYFFDTSANKFKRCYLSCSTCQETGTPTDNKCTQCMPGYYKLGNSSMCQQVAEGYYFDNGIFSKCYYTCAACSAGGTQANHFCDRCRTGYSSLEDKLKNCALNTDSLAGYYFDKTANLFKKCYSTCSECNQIGDNVNNNCNSCVYGYSKIDDQPLNCIPSNSIIPGYYLDTNSNKFTKCYNSCKSCSQKGDDSNHQCLECKDSFYKSEDNSNNCFKNDNPVPGYYFNPTDKLFKHCYKNCYTCTEAGNDYTHNCLTCKLDYFVLEDNNTQCYQSDSLVRDYKFDSSVNKFIKCDEICQQNQESQNAFGNITSKDANALNKIIISLLQKEVNNDIINLVSDKIWVPEDLNPELLENLNKLVEKYIGYIETSNAKISTKSFNVVDKVIDYTNNFVNKGDQSDVPSAQYDKIKESFGKLGDVVVQQNLQNPNLLISTKNFELDIFDYSKSDPEERVSWDTKKTSTVKMTGCGDSIKEVSDTDILPIKKQDLKTDKLKLNPYISNTKFNVTDLIVSRAIEISAYDPKTGKKLDIATLCKGFPLGLDIQANEYTDFNATEYNSFKRLGIDIHDKNKFQECQSFSNNETAADYTTQYVNNLTDVAIDCGEGCTFNDINNVKTIQCKCTNSFKTEFNIFKQTLSFAIQTTKIDIIKCVGTAFKDAPTIARNPSFWFIIALVIFSTVVIFLSIKFHSFERIYEQVIKLQTNLKPLQDKKEKDMKKRITVNVTNLEKQEINIEIQDNDPLESVANIVDNKNETDSNKQDRNEKIQSTEDELVDENYKKFLHVDINQGTAEYCTASELVKYDKRSYRRYLLDIFLTRHPIGKIFFYPNIFMPKYLTTLFFVQGVCMNFAINAILYNDSLINERNKLKDNVRIC